MNRIFIVIFLLLSYVNGAYLEELKWKSGESFLNFLANNSLPKSIYYNLDRSNKELTAEIVAGTKFQILRDDKKNIEQVLIPIGEELQLHIKKLDGKYTLVTTPIIYEENEEKLSIPITTSPYQDIINATKNYLLAYQFAQSYKKSVNFRRIRKGDRLVILYKQKTRLGRQFGSPQIEASMVEVHGKKHFVFLFNKGRYYDQKGREVEGFFLALPVRYTRISDRFTYRRWHPILHIWRAHLGIDYAAPIGTPVKAARAGRIIFEGRKGGYGKVIIIKHEGVFKTLYAHLRNFRRGIRRGKHVKRGQVIGYVGVTGLSTGPHLHFGLYRGSKAINPENSVQVTKTILRGKKRKEFLVESRKYKKEIEIAMKSKIEPKKEKEFNNALRLRARSNFIN